MARRVLIVDDDELVLIALRELLRSEKYEVHTFSRGSAALEKLDQEDFDLLILDIVMPEMDGFELCTLIRKNDRYRDKPILFLTAKNQEEDIKRGLAAGASLFLFKPISPHKLLAVIKETIG
jgi:DNA-binding response OmpR family regulator